MPLSPGVVVGGDFRVLSRLRAGGMGSVWVAEQLSVGRKRALKVMHREIARDARLRERFVQEARIGASIDSDHVVEVVAAGIDEALDLPWLAMELLEGQDLGAILAEQGALGLQEVAEILSPLCHALACAHAAGVVHRDLKPEIVFLARGRRAGGAAFDLKVLDFGIAKVTAEALSTGGGSGLLGTPHFLAPEQAEPNGAATPALDVWALGLLVYEMLAGRCFWRTARGRESSITAILREVLIDPIPPASVRAGEQGVAARLPVGFDAWLERCLEREPARRFPDAGEAYAAFSSLLVGLSPRPADVATHVPPSPSISPQAHTVASGGNTPVATAAAASAASASAASAAEAITVTPLHDDEAFRAGRVGDVVVIHWRRPPTLASAAAMDRAVARAVRELAGRPCTIMPIIDASVRAPDPEARAALARAVERHDAAVAGVAYVVRGEGFQAAVLRGAITSVMILSRPSHTTKVFASIADATAWLEKRRARPLAERPEDLIAGIERFCAG